MEMVDTQPVEEFIGHLKRELERLQVNHGDPRAAALEASLAEAYIHLGEIRQYNKLAGTLAALGQVK